MLQKTIEKPVECAGIGLHSGRKVQLTLKPAAEDTGIVFVARTDDGSRFLNLSPDSAVSTGLATTLGQGDVSVSTVEHLLAAVRGLEIDNLAVEVVGGELPIMDGSAASFVFLLRDAGICEQERPRRVLNIKKPIRFAENGKSIEAEPADGLYIDFTIDFEHPLVGVQTYSLKVTPNSFVREVAKARTFGFLAHVEQLQRQGLALGGSLDNAVVLDEFGVVNPEGLRYDDEFVRHKILDFIGDIAFMGLPLNGRFKVERSGHAFNNEFLRYLGANGETYLEEAVYLPKPKAASVKSKKVVVSPAAA